MHRILPYTLNKQRRLFNRFVRCITMPPTLIQLNIKTTNGRRVIIGEWPEDIEAYGGAIISEETKQRRPQILSTTYGPNHKVPDPLIQSLMNYTIRMSRIKFSNNDTGTIILD